MFLFGFTLQISPRLKPKESRVKYVKDSALKSLESTKSNN